MRERFMLLCCGIAVTLAAGVLQAQFEIRAAAAETVPGWQRTQAPDGGPAIWVAPSPSLVAADIARAQVSTSPDGRPAVAIELTESGTAKMRQLSTAQIGKPIGLVLDGKLIWAPVVRDEIGRQALITGGPNGLTPDEVQRILTAINRP